jgi:uncharacterized DUF497 family protein
VDHRVEYQGVAFVWNIGKADRNLRQHGVSFQEAVQAFFDPFLKVIDASRVSEPRDAVLGMDLRLRRLFVVHVEIEGEVFRVISARRATKEEWKLYEG